METVGKHIVRQPLEALIGTGTRGTQLRVLDMELTERCNNNCIHCYINRPEKDRDALERELSTDRIRILLNEAAALGCLMVRFTGGEPLLRKDFAQIYRFARQCGLKVRLLTNATLITPHLAELFAKLPPLEAIEITLYGMQSATYESVTGSTGSFSAAWQGIRLLQDSKIPFWVKYVRLPQNRGDIPSFENWARSSAQTANGPAYTVFLELRGRRDSKFKNRRIGSLNEPPEAGIDFLIEHNPDYLTQLHRFCDRLDESPSDRLFSCGAGIGCGCVDAYGMLQPCILLRHPDTVYDVTKGSLKEALVTFLPVIRRQKAQNLDYLERCARCVIRELCDQCPARSWMATGELDRPVEACCRRAHVRAERAGLLQPGRKGWQTGGTVDTRPDIAPIRSESR